MKNNAPPSLSLDDLDCVRGGMKLDSLRPSTDVEDRRDWTYLGIDGNTGDAYSKDGQGNTMQQSYDVHTDGWGDAQPSNFDGPFVNDSAMNNVDWAGNYGDE